MRYLVSELEVLRALHGSLWRRGAAVSAEILRARGQRNTEPLWRAYSVLRRLSMEGLAQWEEIDVPRSDGSTRHSFQYRITEFGRQRMEQLEAASRGLQEAIPAGREAVAP